MVSGQNDLADRNAMARIKELGSPWCACGKFAGSGLASVDSKKSDDILNQHHFHTIKNRCSDSRNSCNIIFENLQLIFLRRWFFEPARCAARADVCERVAAAESRCGVLKIRSSHVMQRAKNSCSNQRRELLLVCSARAIEAAARFMNVRA